MPRPLPLAGLNCLISAPVTESTAVIALLPALLVHICDAATLPLKINAAIVVTNPYKKRRFIDFSPARPDGIDQKCSGIHRRVARGICGTALTSLSRHPRLPRN